MDGKASKPLSAFGFLTVLEDPTHGFFGGYLVLSEWGRPLEFHCSTPVTPNRAQKILYGGTLRSYMLGELIGQTLVAKAQLPVLAVLTDQPEMMSLALIRTDQTFVCVEDMPAHVPVAVTGTSPDEVTGGGNGEVTEGVFPEVPQDGMDAHPTWSDTKPTALAGAFSPANPDAAAAPPEMVLAACRLWGTSTCAWRPDQLRVALAPLISHIDLTEPFERIREAIREAQRVSTPPGDEAHASTAA